MPDDGEGGSPRTGARLSPAAARATAVRLRACLKTRCPVARATRLCRPATRRTEWEQRFEPMRTAFLQRGVAPFRSAGRRPERASRPLYPLFKQALSAVLFPMVLACP